MLCIHQEILGLRALTCKERVLRPSCLGEANLYGLFKGLCLIMEFKFLNISAIVLNILNKRVV